MAVPVALFYPVGFFTLWFQFHRYYDFQFATAWQAVSLVSRTTVVGRGASVLLLALIGGVVFSWWVGRIFLWSGWSKDTTERASAWYRPSWPKVLCLAVLFYASSVAGVVFILYNRTLQYGGWSYVVGGTLSVQVIPVKSGTTDRILRGRECGQAVIDELASKNNLDLWPDALLPALIFIIGGIWGGYLIYRNFSDSLEERGIQPEIDHYRFRPRFFTEGVQDRWILSGLATSYLVSVASVLVLALFLQVSLPFLWYTDTASGSGDLGAESGEDAGRFLSHAEGYWYAISLPICEAGEDSYYRSIMAIPDKNVVDVRLVDPDR